MEIGAEMWWGKDCFGKERQALYLGGLNAGHIMQSSHATHRTGEWRGWFMSDEDGEETGWFAEPDAARRSVEQRLLAAIKYERG